MSSDQQISSNRRKYDSGSPLKRWAVNQFFQAILQLPLDADQVLDAGCGEGFSAARLLDINPRPRFFGVDLSLQALHDSQVLVPAMRLALADVTALPFGDDQFDLVVSLEVLEHLEQPERAVQEYLRLSRRYLLLSVPNEPIFRTLRMVEGNDILRWGDHPEHLNHWNFISFKRFLQRNGLRVVKRMVPFPFTWVIVLCERTH